MNFDRIGDVESKDTCVRWTALSADGPAREFRVSRPLANGWRLQMSRADGTFDSRGAAQLLAAELGEEIRADPAPLALDEFGPGAWRIASPDCESSVELFADPFRLVFLGVDRRPRAEIEELSIEGDTLQIAGSLRRHARLYGTGERFNAVDQRGRRAVIWAEDRWLETEGNSYLPIPFVLSTAGYGLFVNRLEGMTIDLGTDDPDRWEISDLEAPLDLYVFVDDSPRRILASLAELTGRAPVPPEWAFGVLVSRHGRTKEFCTPEGVRQMVRKMDEFDLPWSGVILEGWPTYDSERYDELKALVDELHAWGKKALVYDACGRVRGPLIAEAEGTEPFCTRTTDGALDLAESRACNPADAPDRRTSRWIDLTSPDAVRWWTGEVWGRLLDEIGVDGAKIDFCEQFPEHDELALHDGRTARGMHHYYPVKYNTMMYRLFQEKRPEGGVCWSRGGGIGAARYPFAWCGDQLREFRYLRAILAAALSAGLSGVPFMGHDLGGYMPAKDPESNPEPEVFVRGAQLACLGPVMSTHGTVTRPYDFYPRTIDIYRLYSKIHYALIPYLVEQSHIGCAAGLPLMRHMFLHCPNDKLAWGIEDQYFLGEDLLVAPVLERVESRNVYLPSGTWHNLLTGNKFRGPIQLASYPAPLDSVPVFVTDRPGSRVLMPAIDAIRELKEACDESR